MLVLPGKERNKNILCRIDRFSGSPLVESYRLTSYRKRFLFIGILWLALASAQQALAGAMESVNGLLDIVEKLNRKGAEARNEAARSKTN